MEAIALDPASIERFESYVAGLRPVFHRADQFLRFRAYLRGLLEPTERKNIEAIATAARAVMLVEANLAQSLQHFLSHSPWDHRRLLAAVRQQTVEQRRDPGAHWIIHDGVFTKRGRHSVGVQRQYARSLGKKINCQVGVFISQLGPNGYFPLTGRLYLPATWLRENEDAAVKLIPEEHRQTLSKTDIAMKLLDELLSEGEQALPVVAESGYLTASNLRDELTERGVSLVDHPAHPVTLAANYEKLNDRLGLDHFEGRTWHGWHHHVSLVIAAYHFLTTERGQLQITSES